MIIYQYCYKYYINISAGVKIEGTTLVEQLLEKETLAMAELVMSPV